MSDNKKTGVFPGLKSEQFEKKNPYNPYNPYIPNSFMVTK